MSSGSSLLELAIVASARQRWPRRISTFISPSPSPVYLRRCLPLTAARQGRPSAAGMKAPRGHGSPPGQRRFKARTTQASILRSTSAFPGSYPLQRAFGYRAGWAPRAPRSCRRCCCRCDGGRPPGRGENPIVALC